ncbi:MAG: hypothetical protein KGS61_14540 [Verrucomicrobia bacterium]|nr:hypothetical protein [Verrucomicrobiota bacterium]
MILAPSETSKCYIPLALQVGGRPHRDFYYNVTYEAIALASKRWKARKLGICHLSASRRFHTDIATCNAEALAHFCDEATEPLIDSFAFVGCCITKAHLDGILRLNPEGELTRHRPIATVTEERPDGVVLVHLDWNRPAAQIQPEGPGTPPTLPEEQNPYRDFIENPEKYLEPSEVERKRVVSTPMPDDIKAFLRESVFYPCCGLDGAPVKFTGKRFQRYFYVDYTIKRVEFEAECRQPGFCGYVCQGVRDLDFQQVFGNSAPEVRRIYQDPAVQVRWAEPFVAIAEFERLPQYPESHGPARFELMFACCEAIAALRATYGRVEIAPLCLAYIRSGIGFGGGYEGFPQALMRALLANRAGPPRFVLYDHLGGNPRGGDYLSLIERYKVIERQNYRTEHYGWSNWTLAELERADLHGDEPV